MAQAVQSSMNDSNMVFRTHRLGQNIMDASSLKDRPNTTASNQASPSGGRTQKHLTPIVFTKDLIETWVDYKREKEILPISLRPPPYEFELYYGV